MKQIIIILLLMIPFFTFSQDVKHQISKEEFISDIDSIKTQIDSTIVISKKIGKILVEEVKEYGLKKTIQINAPIFLPLFIFIILYLLWLKGRKTKE